MTRRRDRSYAELITRRTWVDRLFDPLGWLITWPLFRNVRTKP